MKKIKFRKNIEELKWYSSGKAEFSWKAEIFLDTNENPYDLAGLWNNRYPDPMALELKQELIKVKEKQFWYKLELENIMIDNGSDWIIDLLVRIFCEPEKDNIAYFSPTFWMYKVAGNINNVWIREFELDEKFMIPHSNPLLTGEGTKQTKLVFICNPNNPSWNITASLEKIEEILQKFDWIVVVDEAYIDFCPEYSSIKLLEKYNNLVVMQTFSKFWWLAWARCGMAFSSPKIIEKLNTVKAPYNVNNLTQKVVLNQLKNYEVIFEIWKKLLSEMKKLKVNLKKLKIVEKVYNSDSNAFLVKFKDWWKIFKYLRENWIIVRDFSWKELTKNCLRISVWTEKENEKLINILQNYKK